MTTPTLYTIARSGPGRLSLVARPRGGEWLEDEMRGVRAAGVDVLVSMLMPTEEAVLGLAGEADAARVAGIRYVALPTPDRGVPPEAAFRALLDDLAGELEAGRHVAAHCRLSAGRAPVLVAGLLLRGLDHAGRCLGGHRRGGCHARTRPSSERGLRDCRSAGG